MNGVTLFMVGQRVEITVPFLILPAGVTGKIKAFPSPTLVTVEIDKELVPRAMGNLVGVSPHALRHISAKIYNFPGAVKSESKP